MNIKKTIEDSCLKTFSIPSSSYQALKKESPSLDALLSHNEELTVLNK